MVIARSCDHFATLYAKFREEVDMRHVDQRVRELVGEYAAKDSPNEKEQAQRLIMAQIVAEICNPVKYKKIETIEKDFFLKILESKDRLRMIPHTFDGPCTIVSVKFGYLSGPKAEDGSCKMQNYNTKNLPRGFYFEIWNDRQTDITEERCKQMVDGVEKLIKEKYSGIVGVAYRNSW